MLYHNNLLQAVNRSLHFEPAIYELIRRDKYYGLFDTIIVQLINVVLLMYEALFEMTNS